MLYRNWHGWGCLCRTPKQNITILTKGIMKTIIVNTHCPVVMTGAVCLKFRVYRQYDNGQVSSLSFSVSFIYQSDNKMPPENSSDGILTTNGLQLPFAQLGSVSFKSAIGRVATPLSIAALAAAVATRGSRRESNGVGIRYSAPNSNFLRSGNHFFGYFFHRRLPKHTRRRVSFLR